MKLASSSTTCRRSSLGAVCTEDVCGKPIRKFSKAAIQWRRAAKLRSARRQRPWNHGRPRGGMKGLGLATTRDKIFGSRGGLGGEPSFGLSIGLLASLFSHSMMKKMKKLPCTKNIHCLAGSFNRSCGKLVSFRNHAFTQKGEPWF